MTDSGPTDTWTGTKLTANLRLMHPLGSGGVGTVYLARHEALGVSYAVKLLHREYASDHVLAERFRREAFATSKLDHPNIVRIIDFGTSPEQGAAYMVMEYLPGVSLRTLLQATAPDVLPPLRAMDLMAQIARGLQAAHDAGIVHRDLKPENLILVSDPWGQEVVKIVDFGMAKLLEPETVALTAKDEVFGTPQYMAPEQALAAEIGPGTDIYAFGCLAYELCTGAPLFHGADPYQIMLAQVAKKPPPIAERRPGSAPVVPAELDGFIMRCLEKHCDHRPESIDAILPLIDPLVDEEVDDAIEIEVVPSLVTQVLTSGWETIHGLADEPPPMAAPDSEPSATASWHLAMGLAVDLAGQLVEAGLASDSLKALLAETVDARENVLAAGTELRRVSAEALDTHQRLHQEANQARWTLCDTSMAATVEKLEPQPDAGTLVQLEEHRTVAEDEFASLSRKQLDHQAQTSDFLAALRKGLEAARHTCHALEAKLLIALQSARPSPCPESIQQGYDEVAGHLLVLLPSV